MTNKFIHLHNHDEFSLLDGLGKAEQYVAEAKKQGFTALGLTNHGNVDGTIKFQKACEKENIQPVIGCELYIVNDLHKKEKGDIRHHVTVFVKNKTGWENLLKLITISNIDGFYRKPRIDPGVFMQHVEGLVVASACGSSFILASWGETFCLELKEKIGDDFYLEIMPHKMDIQYKVNKTAVYLNDKYNIPLVASNDCHYPNKEGTKVQEVLLAIQSKAKWADPKRWKFAITGLYLKSHEQMIEAFKEQNVVPEEIYLKALRRSVLIVNKCKDFRIEQLPVVLPKVPGYENEDETELLTKLSYEGLSKRIDKTLDKKVISDYMNRLEEELGLIRELGFQRYFLIVWELIHWCKTQDIMTGPGRGSVGGSLVAYSLYITDVNPIEYGLIFSRFISPARIDLPDIDMDFEDIKRERIREHLEECYGKNNIAGVSTFLTLKGRAALRDVARVFNIPYADTDAAAKSIVVRSGGDFRSDFSIEDAFLTFEDGIKFKKKYPEVAQIAMDIEGQVRGAGQHAAGMCISREDLRRGERCSLSKRSDTVVANWDKSDAEYMGLMKLDVLGLSALTILSEARKMIKINHKVDIVFDKISLDDKKIYDEISKGFTVGAFQIGSIGLAKFCRELVVENFEELVHATSLWRPGTLRSGMTTEFVLRKHNKKEWSVHPALKELTKDTYGIILYQEQVMRFMYELGGLPWRTCDTVRKVISKSQGDELFMKFKKEFADGCVRLGTLDRKTAEKIWNELSSFGSYGFNKSHAVEYSMITYWDMYLKIYYPAEFMACALTYGSADKKEEYIDECKRLGLKISLPKIGLSHPSKWTTVSKSNRLFTPFIEIKGIGPTIIKQIENLKVATEEGFFVPEKRDAKKKLPNKTIMNLLKLMKAFDVDGVLSEEELDEIAPSFSFSLSDNPMRKLRNIYTLFKEKGCVRDLRSIDYHQPTKTYNNYFGNMTEVKFGYRQNVLKKRAKGGIGEIAGTGESLGGVYGFIKDPSDVSMMVFNQTLYVAKKAEIEHCSGQYFLFKANHPNEQSTLFCDKIIFEEDLLSCKLTDMDITLIDRSKRYRDYDLLGCQDCELTKECKAPVLPSNGRYNVVVVGEAPGRNEDREKEGLIGEAGQVLWKALAKHNISRRDVRISNIVKCFPSKTKTPTNKQIKTCSARWFKEEMLQVKPILILAMGNTCLNFFKNQDKGITGLNGTTEWNDEYKAWISWCLHPASTLYGDNLKSFLRGIRNFVECFENLGGKSKDETALVQYNR